MTDEVDSGFDQHEKQDNQKSGGLGPMPYVEGLDATGLMTIGWTSSLVNPD